MRLPASTQRRRRWRRSCPPGRCPSPRRIRKSTETSRYFPTQGGWHRRTSDVVSHARPISPNAATKIVKFSSKAVIPVALIPISGVGLQFVGQSPWIDIPRRGGRLDVLAVQQPGGRRRQPRCHGQYRGDHGQYRRQRRYLVEVRAEELTQRGHLVGLPLEFGIPPNARHGAQFGGWSRDWLGP
jgi:hypothetical protein